MKRGEIWTIAGGSEYAGKPRPAVIIQDDRFDTGSVTICLLTSDPTDAPLIRLPVEPDETNGLQNGCRVMIDKVTTVRRSRLGSRVGKLVAPDLMRINRALVVFLGIGSGD